MKVSSLVGCFLFLATAFSLWANSLTEITVLSCSDMHGSLEGASYLLAIGGVIDEVRREAKNPPILIDCGDLCKGRGSYVAFNSGGELPMKLLDFYNFDVFVPGNHDYELGPEYISKITKLFRGRTLAANFPAGDFAGSTILERDGVKIGVIGIAHGGVGMAKYLCFNRKYLTLSEEEAVSRELVRLKKDGAQIFILARHYGAQTISESFLKKFPELSLVINAHSHINTIRRVGNALVVQSFPPKVVRCKLRVSAGKVVSSDAEHLNLPKEIKLTSSLQNFHQKYIEPIQKDAQKPFSILAAVENIENLLAQTMKQLIPADFYLVSAKPKLQTLFQKQLNGLLLSRLFDHWEYPAVVEVTATEFRTLQPDFVKHEILLYDHHGIQINAEKPLATEARVRLVAGDQIIFGSFPALKTLVYADPSRISYPTPLLLQTAIQKMLDTPANVQKEERIGVPEAKTTIISTPQSSEILKWDTLFFSVDGKDCGNSIELKKQGKYQVRCELAFTVTEPKRIPFLNFRKPLMLTQWFLNGKRIDYLGDDIFSGRIDGIDGSLLKTGPNVLVCNATVYVGLMPIGSGKAPKASYDLNSFELSMTAPDSIAFLKGPLTGYGTTDRLSFSAITNLPAETVLEINEKKFRSKENYFHQFEVPDLKPNTVYAYTLTAYCRNQSISSGPYQIKTLPDRGNLRFIVLGDSQGDPRCWQIIMEHAAKQNPDFIVHVGDLTSEGNQYHYWDYYDFSGVRTYQASYPRFLSTGNHERRASIVSRLICMPGGIETQTYSLRDDLKIFVLGFNQYDGGLKQYCEKIDQELKHSQEKYIFYFAHCPAWTSAKHVNNPKTQEVMTFLEKNGVQSIFSGHDHSYSRSEPGKGTTQIVSASTSSMPYTQMKKEQNPYMKVFASQMNYVMVDISSEKAEFKVYGFRLKNGLPVQPQIIDSGSWSPRDKKINNSARN